jgi:hypothetical protein
MTAEAEVVGKAWFVEHAWTIWCMWVAFLVSLVTALFLWIRDRDGFRRAFWNLASHAVPPPEPLGPPPARTVLRRETQPVEAEIRPPLQVSIVGNACFGLTPDDQRTMGILIEINVTGQHRKIRSWYLKLLKPDGSIWQAATEVKFRGPIIYHFETRDVAEQLEAFPISEDVPHRGFALFKVQNVDPIFMDYIFGAEFVLMGFEQPGSGMNPLTSDPRRPGDPDNWLRRGKFSHPHFLNATANRAG